MQNQYYNPEINILLCRCRRVPVTENRWKRSFLPDGFWRLYYHPENHVKIICGDTPVLIPAGQLVLIPPRTKLSYGMSRDFKQFYIHFLAAVPYDRCEPGMYPIETDAAVSLLLEELIPEAERGDFSPPSRVFSMRLEALCGLVLSRIPEKCLNADDPGHAVQIAMRHMDQFYGEKLSNQKLARISGMATNSFIRLFRLKTGVAPQRYLGEKRILQAAVLLRYTDRSISEIAGECGFATRYHFSRVFKQIKGYAPAEFRKLDFPAAI